MKASLRDLKASGTRILFPVVLIGTAMATAWIVTSTVQEGPSQASRPDGSQRRLPEANPPTAGREGKAGAPGKGAEAGELMAVAADRLRQTRGVSARIHQRVRLYERELTGIGAYWQDSPARGGRFKLVLRTRVGGVVSALQFTSNGSYIWCDRAIAGEREITRIDLREYFEGTGSSSLQAGESGSLADPRRSRTAGFNSLELGGLPRLLAALALLYDFDRPTEGVLSDVPVYALRGTLRSGAVPEAQRHAATPSPRLWPGWEADLADPPSQFPSQVRISLGADDLFPYRIIYDFQQADSVARENGVPARIEIQFYEVSLGGEVDNRQFEYSPPPDAAWEDITSRLLASGPGK